MNFTNIKGMVCCIALLEQMDARDVEKGYVLMRNLDESIDKETLEDMFSVFGDIIRCAVSRESGYAYVLYRTEYSAKQAIAVVSPSFPALLRRYLIMVFLYVPLDRWNVCGIYTSPEEKRFYGTIRVYRYSNYAYP